MGAQKINSILDQLTGNLPGNVEFKVVPAPVNLHSILSV